MKQRLDHVARTALGRGRAAGAFTCYDLATAHGVTAAAVDAGAVLVDGSKHGCEENVRLILDARERLAGRDVVIEAELGRISGKEDVAALIESGSGELAGPAQAADFVRRTGSDLLAVSVGNVHGTYRGEPVIDHDWLAAVAATVDVPLVLHGASGLPAETIRRCVSQGVGKTNVNTELRRAVLGRLAETAPVALGDGLNLEAFLADWSDAVSAQVRTTLATFEA